MDGLAPELIDGSDQGVIMIPGISSGAFIPIFNRVVNAVEKKGFSVVRIDAWSSAREQRR